MWALRWVSQGCIVVEPWFYDALASFVVQWMFIGVMWALRGAGQGSIWFEFYVLQALLFGECILISVMWAMLWAGQGRMRVCAPFLLLHLTLYSCKLQLEWPLPTSPQVLQKYYMSTPQLLLNLTIFIQAAIGAAFFQTSLWMLQCKNLPESVKVSHGYLDS